jgi:long-chain acyl-CoA synthetase
MRIDIRNICSERAESAGGNTVTYFRDGQAVRKSFREVLTDAAAARRKLLAWGVEAGMRVGIRAPNSYEWMVFDLALTEMGAVTVAFTEDFAATPALELCHRYSLSLLLVSAAELGELASRPPFLAAIDGLDEGVAARPERRGSSTEYCLIFSSGSSGGLKGLSLNRTGIEASIDALVEAVRPGVGDSLLIFLPFSNYQQRMMYYAALWYGFDLILADPPRLFRALKELRPTILIAPPALYEAIENRIRSAPRWRQILLRAAGHALNCLRRGHRMRAARLVFSEVYETLGGSMRIMITGMAPTKGSTLRMFELLQLPLYETYGLIEFGSVSLNVPGAYKRGSVGKLLPGVEISFGFDGEIIAHREPTLAHGYFECAPGESERTFLGGNRVATGDIGMLDRDGYLYLTGRKKEMIVTAGGKKIHPEEIEAAIDECPAVAKSVVFQTDDRTGLVAVIVAHDPQDESARQRIRGHIDRVNLQPRATDITKVIFSETPFSRENGLLRPNLKLDRKRIVQYFDPARAEGANV